MIIKFTEQIKIIIDVACTEQNRKSEKGEPYFVQRMTRMVVAPE
jgi:hypothetical protein